MSPAPPASPPRLLDLSQAFFQGMPVYQGLVCTRVWDHQSHRQTRMPDGGSYASCGFTLSDHAGTHVDAPNHVDDRPDAASIDQIPLDAFFGPALCLDVSACRGPVTGAVLEAALTASALMV